MSLRKAIQFSIAVLLTGLALVACNGGGGEGESTPVEAPTPAPTSVDAAAVTPIAVALDDYLITTLGFEADLARISADFAEALPDTQDDEEAARQTIVELESALSQLVEEALGTLSAVAPPPEAEAYHTALLDSFRGLGDFADTVASSLESENDTALTSVASGFSTLSIEVDEASLEGQLLVVAALEAAGDEPGNAYLISAAEDRLEMSRLLVDSADELDGLLASGDTSGVEAALGGLVSSLEDLEDRWQQLSPTAEAEELHRRQGELIGGIIAVERLLQIAMRDEDQSALTAAAEQSGETSILRDRLEADWNELLVDVLSR